jgi:hypothetical protein
VTLASPRRAGVAVGTTLLFVYLATLAPGITLWDAGEFASAVESLGIPHPPGTPLYVLVARAWRLAFPFLSTAVATNLLAAACTATAAGIATALVMRWMRDPVAAIASGLAFGTVSTVWLNATETEVYSASLLLSMLMLWVGDEAGRGRRDAAHSLDGHSPAGAARHVRLLAYLFAIAPPLHLSAIVAAPAAMVLATVDRDLRVDLGGAALLAGSAVLAVGVGTGSPPIGAAGALILATRIAMGRGNRARAGRDVAAIVAVVAIAATASLFLLVRARLDPAINQGNPTSVSAALDVIARRQYDVPGLWPRRAPFWLQLGNFFQYVDWQFALGVDRAVGASWWRTPFTPLFLGLAVAGSRVHRERDRRSWASMLILVTAATFGVVVYLNLRAGPSYGYGVLPADAEREARERDYFFALGFAGIGLWAGAGAVRAARVVGRRVGWRRSSWVGVAIAALPIALNWRAADRRREPGASLPPAFARATLESTPPNAVLFVAGDNDTYPLWYAQIATGVRPDVTVVTVPLLGATWYREELARRHRLYEGADVSRWRGTSTELGLVAAHAERAGRPIVAAVSLDAPTRASLGRAWVFRGLAYVREPAADSADSTRIDVPAVDSAAGLIDAMLGGAVDPTAVDDAAARYVMTLLACPTLARRAATGREADTDRLLASRCNFR